MKPRDCAPTPPPRAGEVLSEAKRRGSVARAALPHSHRAARADNSPVNGGAVWCSRLGVPVPRERTLALMGLVAMISALLTCACQPAPVLPPGYVVDGSLGTYSLFNSCEAAQPFRVGDLVPFRNGEREYHVRFVELGPCSGAPGAPSTSYHVAVNSTHYSTNYEFFAISGTPEDDFVLQTVTPNEDFPSVSYSFVLLTADGVEERWPLSYDDLPQDARRFCVAPRFERPHPGYVFQCEFESARNVRRYYHEVIYPTLRVEVGGAP